MLSGRPFGCQLAAPESGTRAHPSKSSCSDGPSANVLGWFLGARHGSLSVIDAEGNVLGVVSYIDLPRDLTSRAR